MKKFLMVLVIFGLVSLSSASSAHTTNESGKTAVVMHVEPNDSPAAGEAAKIVFTVNDSSQVFNAEGCSCIVSIYRGDTLITELAGRADSPSVISAALVFPETGTYRAELKANSNNDGFEPILSSYSINVTATAQPVKSDVQPIQVATYLLIWSLVAAGTLVGINILISSRRDKIRKSRDSS